MKSANLLSSEEYIKLLERAEELQNMGFMAEHNVHDVMEYIYEKQRKEKNED